MSAPRSGRELLDGLAARCPAGVRTRYAPAPTGYLHLGHVVNAIFVWGVARALGGRVLLRLEDHDRTRCRVEYEKALLDDLDWLGFVPDVGARPALVHQSARSDRYLAALGRLASAGLVYACSCSRRTLDDLVPHAASVEPVYPGLCRDRRLPVGPGRGVRVRLGEDVVAFDDALSGPERQQPSAQCGDLLVRDRLGQWTYQFAVTVDDLEQDVGLVIRGRDLFESTGRQVLLARMLGRQAPPVFLHHPLLVRPDGAKLSKSDGATGIRELRAVGRSAAEVLGLAAARAGLLPAPADVTVADLAQLIADAPAIAVEPRAAT